MARIRDDSKLVYIDLTADDLEAIRDNESCVVQCPHTDGVIQLGVGTDKTCECCGQSIEPVAVPIVNPDELEVGGTQVFQTAHNDDDVTILVRAEFDVTGGWHR
jgi:hypothetical protein